MQARLRDGAPRQRRVSRRRVSAVAARGARSPGRMLPDLCTVPDLVRKVLVPHRIDPVVNDAAVVIGSLAPSGEPCGPLTRREVGRRHWRGVKRCAGRSALASLVAEATRLRAEVADGEVRARVRGAPSSSHGGAPTTARAPTTTTALLLLRAAQLEQRLGGIEQTGAAEKVAVHRGRWAGGAEARERACVGALPTFVGAHGQRTAGQRHSVHGRHRSRRAGSANPYRELKLARSADLVGHRGKRNAPSLHP